MGIHRHSSFSLPFPSPSLIDGSVRLPALQLGTALGFGIGTGRLALPPSQRGIRVHGIELSPRHGRALAGRAGGGRHRRDDRGLRHCHGEARPARMTLRERWSDWNREPFTSDSMSHISVWRKSS
jgi:hypothetical protein